MSRTTDGVRMKATASSDSTTTSGMARKMTISGASTALTRSAPPSDCSALQTRSSMPAAVRKPVTVSIARSQPNQARPRLRPAISASGSSDSTITRGCRQ